MLRKLGIVVASVLFKNTPSFQLSVVTLLMFSAFALQVKARPFLGLRQRAHLQRAKRKIQLKTLYRKVRVCGHIAASKGGLDAQQQKHLDILEYEIAEKEFLVKRESELIEKHFHVWTDPN